MASRMPHLFLLVLGISCISVVASRMSDSDFSVVQINHPELETESKSLSDQNLCALCKQYTSLAVEYLIENKTQTEVISALHQACSRLHSFEPQCVRLVDYYAPLFFIEIATIRPEEFCEKVNLCGDWSVLPQQYQDRCDLCHTAVAEILTKLKDPDTQLQIIEELLKACDKVESYAKQCKRLILEYAPLILINAEEFLEKRDICVDIRACRAAEEASTGEAALSQMAASS